MLVRADKCIYCLYRLCRLNDFFLNFIQETARVHEQRVNVIQQIDAKAQYLHVIRLLE